MTVNKRTVETQYGPADFFVHVCDICGKEVSEGDPNTKGTKTTWLYVIAPMDSERKMDYPELCSPKCASKYCDNLPQGEE